MVGYVNLGLPVLSLSSMFCVGRTNLALERQYDERLLGTKDYCAARHASCGLALSFKELGGQRQFKIGSTAISRRSPPCSADTQPYDSMHACIFYAPRDGRLVDEVLAFEK